MEISCKEIRDDILKKVKDEIEFNDYQAKLAIIKCNNDFASQKYVNNKIKTCESVGIKVNLYDLKPEETEFYNLYETVIRAINENDSVIIQLPLDEKFKNYENTLIEMIPYYKDCDGLTRKNVMKLYGNEKGIIPCTVRGIYELLKYKNIDIKGKNVVVIGRSKIVGKPMVQLLLNEDATVTNCHSKTEDIKIFTKEADILIVAIGKANYIKKDMVKRNSIVIDVGINRNHEGKVCGDCDYNSIIDVANITPVPKGVGILTTACVALNVLECIKLKLKMYENEIWKDIKYIDDNGNLIDFSNHYQISNFGRIKNSKNNKILKTQLNKGYLRINLRYNGKVKWFLVHRLVAYMFLENPNNYKIINHKDENKLNNYLENLEWCDNKYNSNYGTSRVRCGEKISKTLSKKDLKGENNPMYGKHLTEEHKQKISEIHKGKKISDDHKKRISEKISGEKHPMAKKIAQYDKESRKLIKIWNCAKQASDELNICYSSITACCRGEIKSAGGYIWLYIKEE